MPEYQRPDKPLASFVKVHRVPAAELPSPPDFLAELHRDAVIQVHEFAEFKKLFYGSEARLDLLNATATHFFGELYYVRLERLVLNVSRLTDPAGSGERQNFSVAYVHNQLIGDSRYPRTDAELLISLLTEVRTHVGTWRSKLIAHRDLEIALERKSAGEITAAQFEHFYDLLQRYLTLVYTALGLGPCDLDTPGMHGVDELVKALQNAAAFQELFDADPLTYSDQLRRSKYRDA